MNFAGEWVLVTGASSGIGEAFARALAGRGANIIAVARRRERLEALASRLATRVEVITCDLEAPDGVELLTKQVDQKQLRVSHLVNNAGFGGGGPFASQSFDAQLRMVALNCSALTALTRHYLPRLIEQDAGGVIQVASLAGFMPTPYMAVYGATKAFVVSLTSALAEELRGTRVRMLAVCPGSVPTEFQARAGYAAVDDAMGMIPPELVVKQALRAYESGRHIVVPGAKNALAAFFSRFGSPQQKARAAAIAMKRAGRDQVGR